MVLELFYPIKVFPFLMRKGSPPAIPAFSQPLPLSFNLQLPTYSGGGAITDTTENAASGVGRFTSNL